MAKPPHVDPYIDPASGILYNKLELTQAGELHKAEHIRASARLLTLPQAGIPHTRDLAELQAIHHHLFQDVYTWAGQLRTVEIRKPVGKAEPFCFASRIPQAAHYCANQLREDSYLKGMPRRTFIERIAYHYDQFNYVHPFREGNGRTLRAMMDRIARAAGYHLSWRHIKPEINHEACRIASEDQNLQPLIEMFDKIVEERTQQRTRTIPRVPLYVEQPEESDEYEL